MKKLFLAGLAFYCALIIACKKDNQNVVEDLFIGAMKNGSNWVAKPEANYISGKDSLQIRGFKAAGEESLFFNLKFMGKGAYSIKAGQSQYYTTIGLDVFTSHYKLDTTLTNTVTIRDFDIYTNIANGTFQLNFIKTSGNGADKLHFTGGNFYVYVPE
jgi:hypothetical protein